MNAKELSLSWQKGRGSRVYVQRSLGVSLNPNLKSTGLFPPVFGIPTGYRDAGSPLVKRNSR